MIIYYYDNNGRYTGSGSSYTVGENSTELKPNKPTDIFVDGKWIPYIEPERTEEEIESQRIMSIKAKAQEIILTRYSIVWQLNHPRVDITYFSEYAWIDNIRAISNKAEADGIALEDIKWFGTET